jgi:hypothetical protein
VDEQELNILIEKAKKYDWLRNQAHIDHTAAVMDWRTNDWGNHYYIQLSGDVLDKAIDEAMKDKP